MKFHSNRKHSNNCDHIKFHHKISTAVRILKLKIRWPDEENSDRKVKTWIRNFSLKYSTRIQSTRRVIISLYNSRRQSSAWFAEWPLTQRPPNVFFSRQRSLSTFLTQNPSRSTWFISLNVSRVTYFVATCAIFLPISTQASNFLQLIHRRDVTSPVRHLSRNYW